MIFDLQKIFDANGQFAHANAGCVVNGVGNRRSHARHADFADAAGTVFVHDVVGVIEKSHVLLGQIRASGHEVIGKAAVDGLASTMVVDGVFKQRLAEAHDGGSENLVGAGSFIDDAAAIENGNDAADPEPRDVRLPLNFREVAAERVKGILLCLRIFERRKGAAGRADAAEVGETKNIFERHAVHCEIRAGVISGSDDLGLSRLGHHAAFGKGERIGMRAVKRRARRERSDVNQSGYCLIGRGGGGRQNSAGDHGAAGRGAIGQFGVPEEDIDAIERHAGLGVRHLGEQSVGAGADILRGAANTNTAVGTELNVAVQGMRAADQEAPPTPMPMILPLRRMDPTAGVRFFQPIFSAPVV